MGEALFPPCSLASGPSVVWAMAVMTSLQRTYACTRLYSVSLIPRQATVNRHLCWRLPDTPRQVWFSLLWGHHSFLLGLGAHKVLLCLPRVCFPGGSQSFCRIPSLRNLMWALKFLQQWENFFCFNCSAVCGLSAWGLYDGANGNLLQEDLCHMLRLLGLLKPESLSAWQVTAEPCLRRRHSRAGLAQCLVGVTVLFHQSWCTQVFAPSKPLCRSEIWF